MKKVAIIGDGHSGHKYGITPPSWWYPLESEDHPNYKIAKFQREHYSYFTQSIDAIKPIDVLIVGGDMLDGKEDKQGGMELLTPDRREQCQMAAQVIAYCEAKIIRMVYGTRYHVGKEEDWEAVLADMLPGDVKIEGHGFWDIDGCLFDVKHKVGGSTIPHGRYTAIAKANVWNVMWAERQRQPRANVILRFHNHAYDFCGNTSWVGIKCPGLAYNSAHGIRECEGIVDVGIISGKVDRGKFSWEMIEAEFPGMAVKPESLSTMTTTNCEESEVL